MQDEIRERKLVCIDLTVCTPNIEIQDEIRERILVRPDSTVYT